MEAKHYSSYLSYRPSILTSSIYHFHTYCSDQSKYKLYPVSMTKSFPLHTQSIKSRASSLFNPLSLYFSFVIRWKWDLFKVKELFELALEKKKREEKLKEDLM